ncbi:MAG: hypothetical protein QM784_35500 [Polyangiaceae bacterium]
MGAAGILAARSVARDLGLPFGGFTIGDAKPTLERFRKNRRTFDYLVLDPPRKGSKEILEIVLALKPRAAALIGCDPVSLARDLRLARGTRRYHRATDRVRHVPRDPP